MPIAQIRTHARPAGSSAALLQTASLVTLMPPSLQGGCSSHVAAGAGKTAGVPATEKSFA